MEHTLLLVKPDGYKRRLVGEIISRFEQKGFILTEMKLMRAADKTIDMHYEAHLQRPWYKDTKAFFTSGKIVAMVWSGYNVIAEARRMIGATNPQEAAMGTIRGDFGMDKGRNVIHGSEDKPQAEREIKLWFGDDFDFEKSFDYNLLYEEDKQ
ncbi:hypothetical protein BDAP_000857 [Binucleata daphniae]